MSHPTCREELWNTKKLEIQNRFLRDNVNILVYFEQFQYIGDAIAREKQIKAASRGLKII
ncbi:putative GIY-YIG superfamily endonuclease [Flavobacterium sp. PL11]|uniref:hypothetical protein n=1 Tax=Flavobacterium sp. PL11 TaxID=3071717 RepID=UPI002DF9FED6|nr:putative GIY-YIG superfamily endonuclease [Flavobacterium sp. PL11]